MADIKKEAHERPFPDKRVEAQRRSMDTFKKVRSSTLLAGVDANDIKRELHSSNSARRATDALTKPPSKPQPT